MVNNLAEITRRETIGRRIADITPTWTQAFALSSPSLPPPSPLPPPKYVLELPQHSLKIGSIICFLNWHNNCPDIALILPCYCPDIALELARNFGL